MIENYKKVVFENYANFKGRARRSEFWYFVLASMIISFVLQLIEGAFGLQIVLAESQGQEVAIGIISSIYGLAVMVPGLAIWVRRLHDTEKSGWTLLMSLIPLIGAILLLVYAAKEGTAGINKYGKDPKNPEMDLEDHLVD
jgi:uncharacterized membrane protein YhaH (DUF805 family)